MSEEARGTMITWLCQCWVKHTRYYKVLLHRDLWGDWIVTRIGGQRGSPLGRVRHHPYGSYAEGLSRLAAVARRREQRGYAMVGYNPLSRLSNGDCWNRR